jgi:hypothetical protein
VFSARPPRSLKVAYRVFGRFSQRLRRVP